MNAKVLGAVFKRNFVSYFSNPTGYVFMCLFVALCSAAAFWPEEFFNANLANLNQLTTWFAPIMLVFVPAITMSIWAEERRQGTDELLLTMPANDFDVVIGKYLAALAIYTVSLLFSLISIGIILRWLGDPDFGLIICNFLGYFFVGMAMLAVGMIGSFLTGNLTIAFVLGFLLNVPLVLLQYNNLPFIPAAWSDYGITSQLDDFGRGVISMSSILYFVGIAIVSLYLSMVLLERRHWAGGRDEASKLGHYLARAAALVACVVCVLLVCSYRNVIWTDATFDRINSVSPDTVALVRELNVKEKNRVDENQAKVEEQLGELADKDDEESKKKREELEREQKKLDRELRHLDRKVLVEAFISPKVPEKYEQQRLTLLARLKEIQRLNPSQLDVRIFDTENYSDEAKRATKQYGIKAERREASRWSQEQFFLGAAVTAGLDKVVIPFFEIGVSAEYELVRSILTVGRPQRKKLGIVSTDAHMMGRMDFQSMMSGGARPQPIIDEFEKQYEIVEVNARAPIVDPNDPASFDKYAALLVVQPSSLPQSQMNHLIEAISAGVPTAIFEDPFPGWFGDVPGTDAPRPPRDSMMGRPEPQEPKGDLNTLLGALGIRMVKVKSENLPLAILRKQKIEPQEDAQKTFERLDVNADGLLTFQEFLSDDKKIDPQEGEDQQSKFRFEEDKFLSMDGDRDRKLSRKEFMQTAVIWQNYNPYPKLERTEFVTNEWVFAGPGAPGADDNYTLSSKVKVTDAFSEDSKITAGMKEMLFVLPGAIKPTGKAGLEFIPLVTTGTSSGVIRVDDIRTAGDNQNELEFLEQPTGERYVIAAHIKKKIAKNKDGEDGKKKDGVKKDGDNQAERGLNVVFVADIDPLSSNFLLLRGRQVPDLDLFFQDVPFVLNVVDALAGDYRYVNLRKNEVQYRKLTKVEQRKEEASKQTDAQEKKFKDDFRNRIEKLQQQNEENRLQAEADLKKLDAESTDPIVQKKRQDMINLMRMKQKAAETEFARERAQLEQQRDDDIEKIQHELEGEKRSLEQRYKWLAVFLPPIPPLIVAVVVFFTRRGREQEGVSKRRLR